MFLKRLEIQGFKSFPDKIFLEFNKGIIGFVGPNGSGKSNISDAIRWVLGEQSAKNLRGDKMEDIIFTGTKNRRPLGFAEVSIVLDNQDKKLILDYNEITITRKIYRSGESGYFINGAGCRLKDIHELFMDTGIGKEGYSIIGQGKIDAILSYKSEDRRALFEEAVGIVKFKNRRIQSENRLEEVRKNLIRTNDIIDELEKQIRPLEIQQEKAKQFLLFSEKLKLIRINLFIKEYIKSEQDIKNILDKIQSLIDDIDIIENQKEELIKNKEILKVSIIEKEKDIENFNNDFSKISIDIEQNENNIKLYSQNINFIQENILRIQNQKQKNNQVILNKQQEVNLINMYLSEKNLEYSLSESRLKNLIDELENITYKIDEEEEKFKRINNDIMQKIRVSSEVSNKLTIFKNSKRQFEERNIQITGEISALKIKLDEKIIKNKVFQEDIAKIEEKEKCINQHILKEEEKFELLKKEIYSIKNKAFENNKTHIELKNKYQILNDFEKSYEGYFNSVKAVLKEKNNNPKFYGICGAIGELIKVPKDYEVAIEIALGSSIQSIVTRTEEDAKIAIKYLKDTKNGRATFLPITSIKYQKIDNEKDKIFYEKGFVGIAYDLISFEEKYSNILSSLLGRVIIMDNMDNSINLSKKYDYLYRIVTLDGEFINTGGALTGGSIFKKSGGIFSRGREIKNILENINIIEKDIIEINNIISLKEQEQNNILKSIKDYKEEMNTLLIEKTKIKGNITQNHEYIKNLKDNIQNRNIEIDTIKKSLELKFKDSDIFENDLIKINSEIEELKEYIASSENEVKEKKSHKDFILSEINSLKMNINSLEYKNQNSRKDILRINNEIKLLEKDNIELEKDIEKNKLEEECLEKEILRTKKNIETLKYNHGILKSKYDILNKDKNKISNDIEQISSDILKATTNIADLVNHKTKLDSKKENIQDKIDSLCDIMWEDYEVTYASASNDYDKLELSYDELKKEENNLKVKISNLGNVNVSSIEEYKNVKERYYLNIKQKEDILKADKDLKDIIASLVKEMEEQFKKQFYLINKNFKKVFSEIFGGGMAKLILSNEENVLTSGIDIIVQPPGKNLKNLTLLSGGERTLTAMSLLFAIFRMKPSPFCILDEIEASLDDANVTRYTKFLKRLSDDKQFILITHKTGTMEIADILYGVTMEEQGVSKVISVKLKDAKEYTNEKVL